MSNEASHRNDPLPRQYVLDSNVLISDPLAPYKFDEHNVVIMMTVLEELDKLKDSQSQRHNIVSRDARTAIQTLKNIINGASPDEISRGVPIGDGSGFLRVLNDYSKHVSASLPSDVPDNRIISASLWLQDQEKETAETVLVTKDINLQLKARAAGLMRVEDYFNEQQLDDIAYLASGYVQVDSSVFANLDAAESFRSGKQIFLRIMKSALPEDLRNGAYLNQYWFTEELEDGPVWRVNQITEHEVEFLCFAGRSLMKLNACGITPRNLLQALAMQSLLDPEVDMVQLTGPAGSGKTLLALACGLEQSNFGSDPLYDKLLVTRSNTDMADDIGFLPGTEEEKMAPWLAAFTDSLEVLGRVNTVGHSDDKVGAFDGMQINIDMMRKKANLQFKSLNFMRGRSLQRTYAILDESQNLTPHQMRSFITRTGEGSKLVILGNLSQIDAKYVTGLTSGLTHAVEKSKDYEGGVVVCLPGGERSRLSAYAEEHL